MTRPILFKRTAFTLVEILIVIAIVALLAAIAFPVASRVREKGRSATCQSNLKQIALGMQQYVGDFDGQYPLTSFIPGDQKQWASELMPFVHNTQIFLCPTRTSSGGDDGGLNTAVARLNYDYNILRLNQLGSRHFKSRSEASLPLASQVWLNTDGDTLDPHSEPSGLSACAPWWLMRWGQELHSGGANYSFLDGHVKWLSPGQIEKIECELGDPNFRAS